MASLPVNDALHKDLKIECAKSDDTIKEIVNELVRLYLDDEVEVKN